MDNAIVSDTFIPTNTFHGKPVNVATEAGKIVCAYPSGARKILDNADSKNLSAIRQFGGVAFGAGLDVKTWTEENAAREGVVVVVRNGHGELYR